MFKIIDKHQWFDDEFVVDFKETISLAFFRINS